MTQNDGAGWEAIGTALETIYPGATPTHWGTIQRYSDGGPDPLDGVNAYAADDPPHWHYITFGFSELYAKTSKNLEESGWGFELSFRLKRKHGENKAPLWPVPMLQNLARYVFNTHRPFEDGHYIAWGQPITSHESTMLEAMIFRTDPVLKTIETPNGRVNFIEAIAITPDEYELVQNSGTEELLPRLLAANPLAIVDVNRASLLAA
jgi:suppressor of fused-like protein